MRFLAFSVQHSAVRRGTTNIWNVQGVLIFWVKKVQKWFKKSETKAIQDDR